MNFTIIIIMLLLGIIIFTSVVTALVNYITFPSVLASIEQLRSDYKDSNIQESEDVKGQVVEVNREIKSSQRYNDMFFICWFIPNGWDKIEIITK